MSEETVQERFCEFAYHLGQVAGFVSTALECGEIQDEFASREVKKAELVELFEATKKVAQVFYNTARPV